MGNCNFKADKDKDSISGKLTTTIKIYILWETLNLNLCIAVTKNLFQFQYAIGRGGFGKVWRVEKKKEKEIFAMKEMSKARVMAKKSVQSVMNELKLLS